MKFEKVICIDVDDTLNNFSEVLESLQVEHEDYKWLYPNKSEFTQMLTKIKNDDISDRFKDTTFRELWMGVHIEVYKKATARPDAIKFMQWLKGQGWTVFILTSRDLRLVLEETKKWFNKYDIPYDYFFSASDKSLFCGIWKINYLIDDSTYNIILAPSVGINMYYPITKSNIEFTSKDNIKAVGFNSFDELYEVIK